MSWSTWPTAGPPLPGVGAAGMQPTVLPAAVNSAPAVLPPAATAAIPAGMQYSPEQWAQMQQQNWQQWAQWQQQYQQWHQQYGAEYQKSINALAATAPASTAAPAPVPAPVVATNTAVPPPPPNENKPPPPPPPDEGGHQYSVMPPKVATGYTTAPPPTQQYTTAPPNYRQQPPNQWQNSNNKRPLSQGDEKYDPGKRQMVDNKGQWNKPAQPAKTQGQSWQSQPPPSTQTHAQKVLNLEELTLAETKFDKEFAAWEAQFNKWKEQNANHPDKTQYREYEKKWESWRNSLLERREQMRKKRMALQASMAASATAPQAPNTAQSKAVPSTQTQPSFNQPPPNHQQLLNKKVPPPPVDHFSKPPPTQNNEPLSFKPAPEKNLLKEETRGQDEGEDFLKSSSNSGGIPGLDLVKEGENNELPENDPIPESDNPSSASKGPDLDAISKGINSILGDPKLMNMLSMVSQNQNLVAGNITNTQPKPLGPPPNQPPITKSNPAIPSLLTLPLQPRPVMDQSNHSFEDYSDQYGPNQREAVNNFDDQTRMSFTNGPNDQDVNFNTPPPNFRGPVRTERQDSFGRNDNRNSFGVSFDNNRAGYDRFNNFDGPPGNRPGFNQADNQGSGFNARAGVNHGGKFDRNNDYDDHYNGYDRNIDHRSYNNQKGYQNEQRGYSDNYNEDGWNEVDEYEKYHNMFNDDQAMDVPPPKSEPPPPVAAPASEVQDPTPVEEEPLFVPEVVVDYEHKSLKPPEPEISLDPIYMFDYRHKPVNRIPYPQRPIWLSSTLRNTRQFDPLGAGRFSGTTTDIHLGPSRFSPNDRTPAFERDSKGMRDNAGRFAIEKDDRFSRRPPDRGPRSNEADRFVDNRFERRQDRDFERGGPRGRDFDERDRENFNDRPRNRRSPDRSEKPHFKHNQLDLEELSDDDWNDDEPAKKPEIKDTLRFSPPERNVNRSPELSLSGNPANPSFNNSSVNQNVTLEDLINPPGRHRRPPRIVIILRGPPGSGKTYLAKLIKDREVEHGGSAPRILSLDDYFMVEQEKEIVEDGKFVKVKEMVYEYEAEMEESYRLSLTKAFKKTIVDGFFNFIIVDNVNQKVKYFGELWSFAKQNGFQVYICQMDLDPQLCTKRNIHNRNQADIEDCIAGWEPTPSHHPLVDATNFIQSSGPITEVEMEEVEQSQDDKSEAAEDHVRSKWDTFDCSVNNLARLDGVNKPLRPSRTMEEYLQLADEWEEPSEPTKPGQKRVRWADLEEQKQQKKMKALGFVVGQTDWNRMMDPTSGESALTQTKYIERVRRT